HLQMRKSISVSTSRPNTSRAMLNACVIPNFVPNNTSSAPVSSKPAAKPSSVHDLSNPVCFGACAEPTQSSLYDVISEVTDLKIIGKLGVRHELLTILSRTPCSRVRDKIVRHLRK